MENKNINLLNLTVETKNQKLNNTKLIERLPIETLHLLINSSLLKQHFSNPFSSNCYDNEKHQIKNIKRW